MRPETGVAFIIRDKFSWSLASLQRLYALSGAPFTLYLVDGRYPSAVRGELDAFLSGKDNVVRIEAERFLYPNEALNLVVERLAEPYLFVLQNDVLISRHALGLLLETARQVPCEVVIPVVLDTVAGAPRMHRESDLPAAILEQAGEVHVARSATAEWRGGRRRVHYFETHCLLMSAKAARSVSPLPPLSVHEHVDLSIALWRLGTAAYFDERACALYMDIPPLPLRDFECAYFQFRWDPARARLSDQYMRSKWHAAGLPDAERFVARQLTALRPDAVLTSYGSVFEADTWPEVIEAV